MAENPRHWLLIPERDGFKTEVELEAPDYKVVRGFGNSLWVISKIGEPNVMLPNGFSEKPIYPQRNGHSAKENALKSRVIYRAPVKDKSIA